MNRSLLSNAILLIMGGLLAIPAALAAESEDARLTALFQAYLDREFRARPLDATRLGDHRFDHRLDDVSAAARAGWKRHYEETLAELERKLDRAKLSRPAQIDLEIFRHELTYKLWLLANQRAFEDDPRVYNDYLTDSVYLLFAQSTQPKVVNVKNAAARIDQFPRIVAAARANLKNPPKVIVETAVRQNRGAIAFYENGIYELSGENPATSALREPCRRAVALLKDYQTFLEKTLLPRASGEWRLGKERFAAKLPLELNAGLTAEQVLNDAEAEFARVQREMYVVARQLWSKTHPGKSLPPDDEAGRRDTVARVLDVINRDHGKGTELIDVARSSAEQLRAFIRKADILRLPDPDRCRIIEMPEFQRGNSVAYLNPARRSIRRRRATTPSSPPPGHWTTAGRRASCRSTTGR
ncbi:MAG: DUF885 family protein [Gemmataceae bacterium]